MAYGFSDRFIQILETNAILNGKLLAESNKSKPMSFSLEEFEFKVFSQAGDDGIIQYLINKIPVKNKVFIEFGVADYKESNTRFLLINNNWSGLIMDSSKANIETIKKDNIYWKYDLIALEAFITKENINELICKSGIGENIGFLHIDIVGNNYWVWKEMNIKPVIVSIEYNSVFGKEHAITIPYYKDFIRTNHHYSNLYFGCSLPALVDLSAEKGYIFIGSNSMGNTAYFVRKDLSHGFKNLTAEQGYVISKFRESRNREGELTYLRGKERIKEIHGMPVYNTRTGIIEALNFTD